MKQSFILCAKELFLGSDIVRKYTFKTRNTRGESALFHVQEIDCFECLSPHETAV